MVYWLKLVHKSRHIKESYDLFAHYGLYNNRIGSTLLMWHGLFFISIIVSHWSLLSTGARMSTDSYKSRLQYCRPNVKVVWDGVCLTLMPMPGSYYVLTPVERKLLGEACATNGYYGHSTSLSNRTYVSP